MKGTPFIYQGEEIGMTNIAFDRLDQFRDIETLGQYEDQIANGVSEDDFITGANKHGRDNARTPMQWDSSAMAGFTGGTPWIDVNPNYFDINVEADRASPEGVFPFYQELIALRRESQVLQDGTFEMLEGTDPSIFAYVRQLAHETIYVIANFSGEAVDFARPSGFRDTFETLLSNMPLPDLNGDRIQLAPYQAFAIMMV
jgi:oligo-1,6-glucosidase